MLFYWGLRFSSVSCPLSAEHWQHHAGCQNGNTIKIKGAGVPVISRPSQRGDHIVIVNVVIPSAISEEERLLYRKLYELSTGKKAQGNILEKVKGVFH